jgi:hypothetical protein
MKKSAQPVGTIIITPSEKHHSPATIQSKPIASCPRPQARRRAQTANISLNPPLPHEAAPEIPNLQRKENAEMKTEKEKQEIARRESCTLSLPSSRDAQNSRMPPATSNPSRRRLQSDVPNPCSSIDAASATVAPLPPSPRTQFRSSPIKSGRAAVCRQDHDAADLFCRRRDAQNPCPVLLRPSLAAPLPRQRRCTARVAKPTPSISLTIDSRRPSQAMLQGFHED